MISCPATPEDRLRMLRDCGVVRVEMTDSSFDALLDLGWATRRPVSDSRTQDDYRLTRDGKIAAMRLGPFA